MDRTALSLRQGSHILSLESGGSAPQIMQKAPPAMDFPDAALRRPVRRLPRGLEATLRCHENHLRRFPRLTAKEA
jgi:hypothetical protein